MTAPEWRDCADPDELAAAVAAGVEVLAMGRAGDFPTANQTADQFAGSLRAGITYQLPASWTWRPEPTPAPDELRERIARVMFDRDGFAVRWDEASVNTTARYSRLADAVLAVLPPLATPPPVPPYENDDIARLSPDQGDRIVDACCRILGCEPDDLDGDAAYEEILTEAVERCADLHGQDRWGDDCHGCGFRVGDHTADGRCPTPPPAPPWPGAVPSGLVDEDGVPTWLAQAGQVRGEQVRACTSVPWLPNTSYGEDEWVEVRAPRAMPEPERVSAVSALADGLMVNDGNGDFFCPSYARRNTDDSISLVREDGYQAALVAPDGTVEVLKDGGQ